MNLQLGVARARRLGHHEILAPEQDPAPSQKHRTTAIHQVRLFLHRTGTVAVGKILPERAAWPLDSRPHEATIHTTIPSFLLHAPSDR